MPTETRPHIIVRKALDTDAELLADGVLRIRRRINMFDYSLNAAGGFGAVDYTDTIDTDGKVASIRLQLKLLGNGEPIVETFTLPTLDHPQAQFVSGPNQLDSGEQSLHLLTDCLLTKTSLMTDGQPSKLLQRYAGTRVVCRISLSAYLETKTGWVGSDGTVVINVHTDGVITEAAQFVCTENLSVSLIGWEPKLYYRSTRPAPVDDTPKPFVLTKDGIQGNHLLADGVVKIGTITHLTANELNFSPEAGPIEVAEGGQVVGLHMQLVFALDDGQSIAETFRIPTDTDNDGPNTFQRDPHDTEDRLGERRLHIGRSVYLTAGAVTIGGKPSRILQLLRDVELRCWICFDGHLSLPSSAVRSSAKVDLLFEQEMGTRRYVGKTSDDLKNLHQCLTARIIGWEPRIFTVDPINT